MSKQLFFDKDARALMQKGCNMAANAIKSTLGYLGKTVCIYPGYGNPPVMTKDGVTVAASIVLDDPILNMGALLIRNASESTVKDCGDGTTSSAVLAQSMINAGLEAVNNGANSQEIKIGIEKAVAKIVDELKKITIPLTDNETIKNIATIAANNDTIIGEMLADAYQKMGNNGLLTIERSKSTQTFVTVVSGAEMQRGWANDKFITNRTKMTVEYDNPLIFVANYEIKTIKEITPLITSFTQKYDLKEQPLIVIAKGYEGEPYNTFVVNKSQNGAKLCLVEAPNEYTKEALIDMSILTGAKLITDDAGLKVENATVADCGTCKKIIISRGTTWIIEGAGDADKIAELKSQIITERDNAKDEAVKDVFEKRLARLSGSVGVIYVGASTYVEEVEKMGRMDDANRAIKSAIEEGVVAGGGVALIRCAKELGISLTKGSEAIGTKIVIDACYAPLKTMLANAGINDDLIVPLILKESDNQGYNLKTNEFVDMVDAKIIDPAKVVRCSLQNAASVACQIINSDVLLVEMGK